MHNLLPLIWRNITERYRLLGVHCQICGKDYFPQRRICPVCRRKGKFVPKQMPHEGKIVSFSLVHSAPSGFELEAPYFLALIELSNGVRLLSQLVDSPAQKVAIGVPVRMVFRKIFEDGPEGAIAYGYKFKVVSGEGKKPAGKKNPRKMAAVNS